MMKCPVCGQETVTKKPEGRLVCSNSDCNSNHPSKAWPPKDLETKVPRASLIRRRR